MSIEITHVAVKLANGTIYSMPRPNRHHNVIRHMSQDKVDYKNNKEGFLDDQGNFLDRYEAYNLAVSTGQINRRKGEQFYQGPELYSEDIW